MLRNRECRVGRLYVAVDPNDVLYVVDRDEGFMHVFETSPLKDITDTSATVSYVSNFGFHGETDSFQFVATDGLADSNVGRVFIDVARNFRAPIAHDQSLATLEDIPIDITLTADGPDGIVGFDFNGLDILSYQIIESPPPDAPAGETITIDIVIGNQAPEGMAGLVARAIAMQATIDAPGVIFTGSSEGSCTISPNGQSIDCDFGDFAVGEQRTVILSFARDPNLLDDVEANVRLSVTTSSEAINDVTEVYLTRDLRGERIFPDRFRE